jgi:hypothetical protein
MSLTLTRAVSVDPTRSYLAFLEEAEQHGLRFRGQLADLVQEEGAGVGRREEAGLPDDRARERPALVAEQLA